MYAEAAARRQRTIQMILVVIILATLPCYCVGFGLLAVARTRTTGRVAPTSPSNLNPTVLFTSATPRATLPFGATILSPLQATPTQLVLPVGTSPLI
ncbi:MAG TPA: hypothetical protein PLD47_10530, partial [Aggregatilineales bacterium]|nr:hypothetical protein [Aggregatilineales bacterium]